MQLTEEVIRNVVQEVLVNLRNGPAQPVGSSNGRARAAWGVFDSVADAVAAASESQRQFERRSSDDRRQAINCIRKICIDQAEPLGREEFEETKIGRLPHKVEKMIVAGEKSPGIEFLKTDAFSGSNGIALTEYAPLGVIGVITPVTHSLPTL